MLSAYVTKCYKCLFVIYIHICVCVCFDMCFFLRCLMLCIFECFLLSFRCFYGFDSLQLKSLICVVLFIRLTPSTLFLIIL